MTTEDMRTAWRTHRCGALRATHAGQRVRLGGWVHRTRDLGGIIFIDLRDRDGIVQLSVGPDWSSAEARARAAELGPETVVIAEGEVIARPDTMRNAEMSTGDVEVRVTSLEIVGPAVTPAIPVALGKGEKLPGEELRLRYRYLDLRRPELQRNLMLRHRLMQVTRQELSARGFLEIETPILTKPTPEGARDFLVPSRVHPGEFYALPQSPQLYKQLLMMSGMDRYFQIARCFRDEDLRADRQLEFTQIDIEAAFVDREDIFSVAEGVYAALWKEAGHDIPRPFERMAHRDAMERYGSDKPDLRYDLALFDASDLFRNTEFTIARSALAAGGRVRGLRIPGGASLSRKQVDELEALARSAGAAGLVRVKRTAEGFEGQAAKFLPASANDTLGLKDGDLALFVAAGDSVSSPALDRVRQEAAKRLSLVRENEMRFLWVTDFPLFAVDPSTGALASEHHPFTNVHPEDVHLLDSDPGRCRALAYDTVYNGMELASGSIRISDPRFQSRIFSLLGIDAEDAERRFGFLLEGLRSGAPPHGGIALGFDRISMLLAGGESLRDVIAFPKTTAARALFEGAPTRVTDADVAALHLRSTAKA